MEKIELLAPAGSYSKLKTALHFGADAVYVGGKNFSLRSFADNFTPDELAAAVELAHSRGKKLYVTVNIFARNADLGPAGEYFEYLEQVGADAAIVTDPGLFSVAKKRAPGLSLHISTQANTLNGEAVKFWAQQGAERVILARELSVEEIAEIKDANPEMQLEAFVHGAMCISYSGRCLLSNYLSGRDSNKGECVQACRWNYEVREFSKGGEFLPVEEDGRGSYIFNSKDLNMLRHLDKLAAAGVDSFKIEGRMKSEYYLATVINAYRKAVDLLGGGKYEPDESIIGELKKAAHRDYTTAYMLGENTRTVNYDDSSAKGDYEFTAAVLSYGGGKARVEMRNRFKEGDELEILSPSPSFNKTFTVKEMYADGKRVSDAKLVQQVLDIDIPFPVEEGDILRRKIK